MADLYYLNLSITVSIEMRVKNFGSPPYRKEFYILNIHK